MDKSSTSSEIQVGVSLTAFFGTAALFFTGILISQLKNFNSSIKVPILYLIISTFSFIFSASIYANASGEQTRHNPKKVHRYMAIANNISEFLGLYLFVVAIPLVINAISTDTFLRVAVPAVAVGGLMLYSQSPFSILHRELHGVSKMLLSLVFGLIAVVVDVSQLHQISGFTFYASFLLAFTTIFTLYFCLNTKQLKDISPEI